MATLILNANTSSPLTISCQKAGKSVPRQVGAITTSFNGANRSSIRGQAKVVPILASLVDTATEATIQAACYNGAQIPCSGDILQNIQTLCSIDGVVSNMVPGLPGFFEMSFTVSEVNASTVLLKYSPGDTITGETFTRASTATYFDANGVVQTAAINAKRDAHYTGGVRRLLLEKAETNICLRSQEFDNATWSKTGVAVTANATTAPDGTATADFIKEDATTGDHRVFQTIAITIGQGYGFEFFAKAAGRTLVMATEVSSTGDMAPGVVFDLAAGTVSSGIGGMVALANGWYRCYTGTVSSVNSDNFQIRLVSTGTTTSYAGDNASGVYLWGAGLKANGYTVAPYNIATEGDSITVGSNWPAVLGLPVYATLGNHAVSGTTTVDMRVRYDTYKTGGQTHFLMLGGINDVRLDVAPATTQANLLYMWGDAVTRGMKIVAMTTTPFKNDATTWTATRNANQIALNTFIRTQAAALGYPLVDLYALLGDPADATALNPAYDSGDGIHPNAAGQQKIANAVRAAALKFAPVASSYIATTTVAVTRSADSYSLPFAVPPQELTMYVKGAELGTLASGTPGLAAIGGSSNASFFILNGGTGLYQLAHRRATDVTALAAASLSGGDSVELRALLHGDGSVLLGQAVNSAAEVNTAQSVSSALATSWVANLVYLNERAGPPGFFAFESFKIVAGVRTLAEMRAA